jgi:DNA repair protein RecO (recombination protein O)
VPRVSKASRSLDGIVLHLAAFGEAHRLVEVLTPHEGRLTVVARGARASRRRFAGILELFGQLRLQVQGGAQGGMGTLAAAELQSARAGIRTELGRISRASALCACVRHLFPEHQAAPEAYALLTLALDYVAAGAVARAAGAYPRLAQAAGILPDLSRCGRCGRGAEQGPLAWVPQPPGILCATCAPGRPALAPNVLAALRGARIDAVAVGNAVEDAVIAWTTMHSGRALTVLMRGD